MRRAFSLTSPVPLERDIHEATARALDLLLLPPAFWFTYPAGATTLSPQQQSRYSRIGLKRGIPDILILHQALYGIELKRPKGRLSKTTIGRTKRGSPRILEGQEDVFPRLLRAGMAAIAICTSVTEVLDQLKAWGIPTRMTPYHGEKEARLERSGAALAAANGGNRLQERL